MTVTLEENIQAYDGMKRQLERRAWGRWVVINNKQLVVNGRHVGFNSEAEAIAATITCLANGQHPLLRQVGAVAYMRHGNRPDMRLPDRPTFIQRLKERFRGTQPVVSL